MKRITTSCLALSLSAAALLTACGGSQPPIGAMPQSRAIVRPLLSYEVLRRFRGHNGRNPEAAMINVNGNLYGTTFKGGAYHYGTVFSVTTYGKEKALYSFGRYPTDGAHPAASLTDVDGTLYGTTAWGGANGYGTVFSITQTGTENVLYSFAGGSDGANPEAGLIDVNGKLYGTTSHGGGSGCFHYGCGTVYSISLTGEEKIVHSFANGNYQDGATPFAGLIDMKGTLYGTTETGGANDYGTVFSVTASGYETILHSFRGGVSDGFYPEAGLLDAEGTLYGTTITGGAYYGGIIFSITTSSTEKILYNFGGSDQDGAAPYATLINVNGTLYGTTDHGGANDVGTVFSVTMTGSEKVLYSFRGGSDGSYPMASLINVDGALYGTTVIGGSDLCFNHAGCGTVFSMSP